MSRFLLLATVAALTVSACSKQTPDRHAAAQPSVKASQTAPSASSPSGRLLAAAEPFEAVTETAFTDPPSKLAQTVAAGRKAVADVRPLLNGSVASKVDGLLADMDRARAAGKQAELALSSIEVYRALVSSVPPGTKVPVDVSLLDYAGFRYQADLKSKPVRWDDMAQAVTFAGERWAQLAPQVKDKAVSRPFEAELANMKKAAAKRDVNLARASVTAELDLVDKLESYFAAP